MSETEVLDPHLLPYLYAIAGAFVLASLAGYGYLAQRVRTRGGQVSTAHLGLPDLLVSGVLVIFFINLALLAFSKHGAAAEPKPESLEVGPIQVLASSGFLVLVVLGIFGFLRMRKIPLRTLYGVFRPGAAPAPEPLLTESEPGEDEPLTLEPVSAPAEPRSRLATAAHIFFTAVALLVMLVPALLATANLVLKFLPKDIAGEQELVGLFRDEAARGNLQGIGLMVLAAGVLAPLLEETLFRGYFYPTFKKYLGAGWSALFTSLLFAAVHANILSFAGLLLLALCLTLAYEWSGSLWLPITMHSLFNAANLAVLYFASTQATS